MRYSLVSLLSLSFVLLFCACVAEAQSEEGKTYRDLSGEDFITEDGVKLAVSFYPSDKGKESIPVLLLHDWGGDRRSLHSMASFLQKNGCAVLVPDLRGHGDSNKQLNNKGREVKLSINRPSAALVDTMVKMDVEQCKRYLITQNDDGKVNIQKLCVVGVGAMGCALASAYTSYDWSWDLSQGGDVKALGLISPESNYIGIMMKKLITPNMAKTLSVMILFGGDDTDAGKEARQVYKLYEKFRPGESAMEPLERSLFAIGIPTTLQGAKLLGNPGSPVEKRIAKFIELRLQTVEIFWKLRRNNN